MKYVDLETFVHMDSMIARKSTGAPECFARKLDLSRSTFFEYLAYFKDVLGLNIQYNMYKETYYYSGNQTLCSALKNKSCLYCDYKECRMRSDQARALQGC